MKEDSMVIERKIRRFPDGEAAYSIYYAEELCYVRTCRGTFLPHNSATPQKYQNQKAFDRVAEGFRNGKGKQPIYSSLIRGGAFCRPESRTSF